MLDFLDQKGDAPQGTAGIWFAVILSGALWAIILFGQERIHWVLFVLFGIWLFAIIVSIVLFVLSRKY